MKKVLLAVVGILFAATSFAQNALVASLSHGTSTTYFYGVTALQQAVKTAQSGDIISLSGGSFNATDITIGITLRGAGIDSPEPTYIVGDFTIEIPGDDVNRFMMEGIRCTNSLLINGTFANPFFQKCQFNEVGNYGGVTVTNIMFSNCKITKSFGPRGNNSYILVNCFINNTTVSESESATVTATNCIFAEPTGFHVYCYERCQLFNCIIISLNGKGGYNDNSGYTRWIPSNSQAQNCYMVNFPEFDIFGKLSVRTGCPTTSLSYGMVFKTYNGEYSDTETFELTETAKTTYLGTDEKQIGLYGGLQPYDSTPSYPLISTMNLPDPAKTNDQGKMNVTIGISSPAAE